MKQFAIVVLAAGSSSRMGQTKQLLPLMNTTLLRYTVSEALSATNDVVVVLGANDEMIRENLKNVPVDIVHNSEWQQGMSSSIKSGVSFLTEQKSPDAIIIMVADQPFVSSSLLIDMMAAYERSGKMIVACSYSKTVGVPVLFDKSFFDLLMNMEGQTGAKQIIADNMNLTQTVAFPKGNIDIDTKEDYETFKKMNSGK